MTEKKLLPLEFDCSNKQSRVETECSPMKEEFINMMLDINRLSESSGLSILN